ncbi:MAG: hypothetical protein DRI32_01030 [Chloroflexi bacterium]|nr:MAG: hypothetical protein DRI32_01030 [Chloroflexota bacterium]
MSQDRRIRRTQKLLGEALISLALEKGYKNITIQEVTERADIGYRTYFRHYAGLDELLVDVAQSRSDEIYEILNIPPANTTLDDPIPLFREIGKTLFQHVEDNLTDFRFLLLDNSVRFVLEPVIKKSCTKIETLLSALPQNNISAAIAANHIIASAFSLMRWWLLNDMPHSPERMGEIFTNLIVKPTWLVMTEE